MTSIAGKQNASPTAATIPAIHRNNAGPTPKEKKNKIAKTRGISQRNSPSVLAIVSVDNTGASLLPAVRRSKHSKEYLKNHPSRIPANGTPKGPALSDKLRTAVNRMRVTNPAGLKGINSSAK
jgi:hypothetical protein